MPSLPIANLVVGQTRFALRTLDALFDAMFGFGRSRKHPQFGCSMRVGQIVVRLNRFILSISEPNHDQCFLVTFLSLVCARYNACFNRLNYQWTLRSVRYVNFCPLIVSLSFRPLVDASPRAFRVRTNTRVRRWSDFQITNERVARNSQQVSFVKSRQTTAKPVRTTHFVIASNPRVRQHVAVCFEHLQAQLMTRSVTSSFWHAGFLTTLFVARPLFGKKQSHINQRVFVARNISHVNRNLAVVDFTVTAAPLPRYANRFTSRFGKSRRIKDQNTIIVAQVLSDLKYQSIAQWFVIPIGNTNEPLQWHTFLSESIRDRLHVLILQIRKQSLYKSLGVRDFFTAHKRYPLNH